MVIAVDGPSGVGKSTVGRAVAAALDIPFLSTGVFYRAVTLAAQRAGVPADDVAGVLDVLAAIDIDTDDGRVLLDGEDVTAAVRSEEITAAVSAFSAIPEVREELVVRQRSWVTRHGGHGVVEGRDIGTVVFTDADLKVFLDASAEVRASRRAGDREARGRSAGAIADDMRRRDRLDSTREASPLQAAPDAVIIDTSNMTEQEVVDAVVAMARQASSGR